MKILKTFVLFSLACAISGCKRTNFSLLSFIAVKDRSSKMGNKYNDIAKLLVRFNTDLPVDFIVTKTGMNQMVVMKVLNFFKQNGLVEIEDSKVHIKGYNKDLLEKETY